VGVAATSATAQIDLWEMEYTFSTGPPV